MGFYVTVYAPKEVKEKEENNVKLAIFVCPFWALHCLSFDLRFLVPLWMITSSYHDGGCYIGLCLCKFIFTFTSLFSGLLMLPTPLIFTLQPLMLWVRTRSDEVYSIQHHVVKFVSDLRQVCGFLRVLRFPPPIKLTAMI
jgi:hypothetical protein